jgi:hypothetical protein
MKNKQIKQNVTKDSGQSPQVIIKSTDSHPNHRITPSFLPPPPKTVPISLKTKNKTNLLALPFDDELQQSRE